MLDRDGLIVLTPMSGAKVATLSEVDIREITDARLALETHAVRKLAREADPDELATAATCVARLERAVRARAWASIVDSDVAFHRAIVAAAGNKRVLHFWQVLEGQLALFLSVNAKQAYRLSETPREHQGLLDAIGSRDANIAVRAFTVHITERMSERGELWKRATAATNPLNEQTPLGKRAELHRGQLPHVGQEQHEPRTSR